MTYREFCFLKKQTGDDETLALQYVFWGNHILNRGLNSLITVSHHLLVRNRLLP